MSLVDVKQNHISYSISRLQKTIYYTSSQDYDTKGIPIG